MEKSKFDNFIKSARKIKNVNDIKKGDLLLKIAIGYDWFYFGIVLETSKLRGAKIFLLDHKYKLWHNKISFNKDFYFREDDFYSAPLNSKKAK